MYKLEDYLNNSSYPYFSAYEKIRTIDGKEELIVGKDKYYSIMDTYIAKYITDEKYDKDEVITNLIDVILSQLELRAYKNTKDLTSSSNKKVEFMVPPTCFIRQDFEDWEYKIDSINPNVKCTAVMCRVGFLSFVKLKHSKTFMLYESDFLLTKEVIDFNNRF